MQDCRVLKIFIE